MIRRVLHVSACVAVLTSTLAACAGLSASGKTSDGIYRIPYGDGTHIRVSNDHRTHNPPNRLDIIGLGAPPYRIVAAAGGVVRYIVDEFDTRQDSKTARQCNNNYVWLEHPNGEWTKYSHLRQHSARRGAKLNVGDTVPAGAYLGDEGDVGCATRSHLHFEVAVPRDRDDPIALSGGFIKGENRVPRFCGVPGEVLVAGTSYRAENCVNPSR
jgi:murein DD-endopeptidase MepM/ murein hydrolase activator NlpD